MHMPPFRHAASDGALSINLFALNNVPVGEESIEFVACMRRHLTEV